MGVFYSAIAASAFSSHTTVRETVNNTKSTCMQFWPRFSRATSDLIGFNPQLPKKSYRKGAWFWGKCCTSPACSQRWDPGGRACQEWPSLLLPLSLLLHWIKQGCFIQGKVLIKRYCTKETILYQAQYQWLGQHCLCQPPGPKPEKWV